MLLLLLLPVGCFPKGMVAMQVARVAQGQGQGESRAKAKAADPRSSATG
jgi:hypothetical protein